MSALKDINQWLDCEVEPRKSKLGYATLSVSFEDDNHELLTAIHIISKKSKMNKLIKRVREIYDNHRTKLL